MLVALLWFAVLVCTCQAANTTFTSCSTGNTTLTMTNISSLPAACTNKTSGTPYSAVFYCLTNVNVSVSNCQLNMTSGTTDIPGRFPCHSTLFSGFLSGPNTAAMTGSSTDTAAVFTWCVANPAVCQIIQSGANQVVYIQRMGDTFNITLSAACSFTYQISGGDTDLLSGSAVVAASPAVTGSNSNSTSPTPNSASAGAMPLLLLLAALVSAIATYL